MIDFTTKDINGNGLVKIGDNLYQSTTTGNKYEYNGKELILIEEGKEFKGMNNVEVD